MLDRYWFGPADRISPEAPVPVVTVNHDKTLPGGAGNVACNIKALGASVSLLGVIGRDANAKALIAALKEQDIDTRFIESKHPTITKLRVMSLNQQLMRLDFEEPLEHFDKAALLAEYEKALENIDLVVLSDYLKGTLYDPKVFIALANKKDIPVLVDPKGSDFSRYEGASLITPNRKEFESVVGTCHTDEILFEKAFALQQSLGIDSLLVTRGDEGMSLFKKDQSHFHLSAIAKEVFDVTGAGDTVIATLAVAIASHTDIEDAARLANYAASISISKLGASIVTVPELRRTIRIYENDAISALTLENLQEICEDAKAHGERIVMTNGCFDILHAGHVRYLEQAKAQGDRLVVAVNDDDSIKRLKGPTRPIVPLERRMAVLSALASVDWVVPFSEDTPSDTIRALKPDILVKGGDYTQEQVVGHEIVKGYGGQVKVLHLESGVSTTSIIERARELTPVET